MEFDVLIAGAGLAGVLAAARLRATSPTARIALVEKSSQPGGRLRSSLRVAGEWSYGLSCVSEELFQYIQQSLTNNPHYQGDLAAIITGKQENVGFLTGGKLHQWQQRELFSAATAKILGGPPAAEHWEALWELIADPAQRTSTLAKQGKHFAKNPAAAVISQFAPFCGLADLWHAPLGAILDRSHAAAAGGYFGPWETVLEELLAGASPQLSVFYGCQIGQATLQGDTWEVIGDEGTMKARWLLVAQSPWEAVEWLDRNSSHPYLWSLASQSKPTSAVVLVEKIDAGGAIASELTTTFVAAEETLVYRLGDGCITCHTIIDYEQSLNSPIVVKAIKQLRRALAKYKKALPGLETSGEYLALKPVAWPQTSYLRTPKIELINDPALRQSFCGDAYGSSFLPDQNLIDSLVTTSMQFGEFFQESL